MHVVQLRGISSLTSSSFSILLESVTASTVTLPDIAPYARHCDCRSSYLSLFGRYSAAMIGRGDEIGNCLKPCSTERAHPPQPLVYAHTCGQLDLQMQSLPTHTAEVMSRYGKSKAPGRIHRCSSIPWYQSSRRKTHQSERTSYRKGSA